LQREAKCEWLPWGEHLQVSLGARAVRPPKVLRCWLAYLVLIGLYPPYLELIYYLFVNGGASGKNVSRSGMREFPLHKELLKLGYKVLVFSIRLMAEHWVWLYGVGTGGVRLIFLQRDCEFGDFARIVSSLLLLGGENLENIV